MKLLTTTSVGTIFAAASSVYPHKMQMDRAVLPDSLSSTLGRSYGKLLRKGSHRLYYSYLCGDTGITAERNFADPEYTSAYYGLCSQGVLCKTYEFISNKLLADQYAGTFYSVEQCSRAEQRLQDGSDDLQISEGALSLRRQMDINLTLEIMRRLGALDADPRFALPTEYFNLHHTYISEKEHAQSCNNDEFHSGLLLVVSSHGHLIIKINTRREDYYNYRKTIDPTDNYSNKDFGMVNTVLVLSPEGNISFYYPEDHWKTLGTEPNELIHFDTVMGKSETISELMLWHLLYAILRTSGDIFEIAPYLTKEQMCALFYESAQAAQNPVPGIKAPQEGALSDLLATISSKITLIPSSGRS